VHFVIGQSDWHKDWNIMQVPRASDASGRGWGDGTTWSVEFEMPEAPRGRATLRVALAGTEARRIVVGVNGKQAGVIDHLLNTTVIHRDADRGYWQERDVSFDASMMKNGKNILTLSIPGGPVTAGVEYDYLRLELADSVAVKK
jgi:rhamnogalacturonan endolyase